MGKIKLSAPGYGTVFFKINDEPKPERDLLRYSEYRNYYHLVGLGAAVSVEVITDRGFIFKEKYKFSFTVRGNSISWEEADQRIKKYAKVSFCEEMKVDAENAITYLIYSFRKNEDAYALYKDLENIANIGVYHGMDRRTGKFLIQIEYHQIPEE